jgi:acyl carrier protein
MENKDSSIEKKTVDINNRTNVEHIIKETIISVQKLTIKADELADELEKIDSLQSVEILLKLEQAFSVMFDDEELQAENWTHVTKITDMVIDKWREQHHGHQ